MHASVTWTVEGVAPLHNPNCIQKNELAAYKDRYFHIVALLTDTTYVLSPELATNQG
jgi:hypothetical protein